MSRTIVRFVVTISLASGVLMTTALNGKASAASNRASTITIGYITSETGVAASSFQDGPGAAQARVALQNSEGGVNGHKLKLIVVDDGSSVTGNQTAAQSLVETRNAFGIVDFSAFTFGAASVLNKEGIPVTGYDIDGPEWGQQPNTNMFSASPPSTTPFNGNYYGYFSGQIKFLKSLGVTKLAALTSSISPSAVQAQTELMAAANKGGISKCYNDTSLPFAPADFSPNVLAIKNLGCNGVIGQFTDAPSVALSSAVKNAGIKAVQYEDIGYDSTVQHDPAAKAALDGDYFPASINFTTPNPAVRQMLNALVKYDPSYKKGDIPDLGIYGSYLGVDLMIKGLQLAGKHPTRQSFITNLHKLNQYNAGGILPDSLTYRHFGTADMLPSRLCTYIVQLKGSTFVVSNGGVPICSPKQVFAS